MKLMTLFATYFFIFLAHAGIQQDFAELKNQGRNLQDTGAICEEVARLEMQRQYGHQFEVLTGIEYSGQSGSIGELDVVVFNRRNYQVVLIGEVKCWKDMEEGLRKAHDQRQKFFKIMNSMRTIYFHAKDDSSVRFSKQQFSQNPRFVSIAQKGGVSVGYDFEFNYSLAELMELRNLILRCQSSGACKRPSNYRDF